MDHSASEEGDLESGGTGSEDELSSESIRYNKPERNVFGRLKSDFLGFEGYDKDGNSWSNYYKSGSSGEVSYGTKDLLIDKDPEQVIERLPLLEKKLMKEKRENSIQKASKPPRPPKGPTLDILDLKLVTEISELSMKRRARIKRIKALKKMKAKIASSSSPSSSTSSSLTCSLAAIVATLFFLIVIFFQGFLSKNSSSTNFKGSPEPAAAAQDQISVRLFNSTTVSEGNASSSIFSKSVLFPCFFGFFHYVLYFLPTVTTAIKTFDLHSDESLTLSGGHCDPLIVNISHCI